MQSKIMPSKSSDDESGKEKSNATTEPLVELRINNSGGTSAYDTRVTLHPAVSSGDLNLVQALKQEQYLRKLLQHSFVPNPGYRFPNHIIRSSVQHFKHRWKII